MKAKDYLLKEIQMLPKGAWDSHTGIAGTITIGETLPEAVEGGYEITEYHLRVNGTIIRRVIKYRNPRLTRGIPEETGNIIHTDAVWSVIGDPEYHELEIGEDEYREHMEIAVQKLETINELAKKQR